MSKVILNDIATLSSAITNINANSAAIETAIENTLSRDGTSPNQMGADLDMNSNRIVNLLAPASATEPLRLQDLTSFIGGSLSFPSDANNVTFAPTGTISSTNVQTAVAEVASEAATNLTAGLATKADTTIPFVTIGNTASLSAERSLAVGTPLILTDAGVNSTATIDWANTSLSTFALSNFPFTDDCNIRVAAGVDGHSIGIVYMGESNGLWLRDSFTGKYRKAYVPGAFQVIDLQNCTINGVPNQSVPAAVLHYIYAYINAADDVLMSIEFSTTAFTQGGESPVVKGWRFKNDGTFNKRLIGAVKSDVANVFWRANTFSQGVFMSGISSAFKRQVLNYHTKVSGGNAAVVWTEINSAQYLSAFMWDDGNEPFIALAGSVSNNGAGNTTSVGVLIDGATTPDDFVDVYCAIANKTYPFTVIVRGGDFTTDLHTYKVVMKNDAGTGNITGNRVGTPATGATFAMKLEQ